MQLKTADESYSMIHAAMLLTFIPMLLLSQQSFISQFCTKRVRRAMQIFLFVTPYGCSIDLKICKQFCSCACPVQHLQVSDSFAKC